MKRILAAALALSLNFAYASAQEACESKAISKYGKPLVGAAKASFLKNAGGTPVRVKRSTGTASGWRAPLREASCKSAKEKRRVCPSEFWVTGSGYTECPRSGTHPKTALTCRMRRPGSRRVAAVTGHDGVDQVATALRRVVRSALTRSASTTTQAVA